MKRDLEHLREHFKTMVNHSCHQPQPVLIITGMHRSGTSLVSSLLQSAGLDIGDNLLGADEAGGNPLGHYENVDFYDFHQRTLTALGIDKIGWTLRSRLTPPAHLAQEGLAILQNNRCSDRPWGWKEPRTTLFLDFWLSQLPEARFLFIYRPPWEVIDSLYRRGDPVFLQDPVLAIKIWLNYNRSLLRFFQENPERCMLVNIHKFIDKPFKIIKELEKNFSITLSLPENTRYQPDLFRRIPADADEVQLVISLFPRALRLYNELNELTHYPQFIRASPPKPQSLALASLRNWMRLRHTDKAYQKNLQGLESESGHYQKQSEHYQKQSEHDQKQKEHYRQQCASLELHIQRLQKYEKELLHSQVTHQRAIEELAFTTFLVERYKREILRIKSSKLWYLRKLFDKVKALNWLKRKLI